MKKDNLIFKEKSKEKHGNKYDYSLVNYVNNKTKVKIICKIHGEFEQQAGSHMKGSGCSKCNDKKSNKESFIIKAELIHKDKYDYSLVNYVNNKTKVKIICPIHSEFEQEVSSHLKGNGCPKCSGKQLSNDEYIVKIKLIHGNKYDYSKVEYQGVFKKIKIICNEHGEFEQMSDKHLKGHGCPICKESKGEKEIRKYLIENGIIFISQYKFPDCKDKRILPFDFYLPDYNTCVEYDGRQHFEVIDRWGGLDGLKDQEKKDKIKTNYCKDNKIKLLRISHKESIYNKLKEIN